MPTDIIRFNDQLKTATFTDSDNTTEGFNMAVYSGAIIMVDAVQGGATTLSWKCRPREGDATTFVLANNANTPVTTTIAAGRAYQLPDQLFAAGFVLATTNAGTASVRIQVKG